MTGGAAEKEDNREIIQLPNGAEELLRRLEACGFEGWVVGGCVRDALLGQTPHDWDLCTNATPAQMHRCFAGLHLIDTGLRHGTVTARVDHQSYEVTTYRADGFYEDGRRPNEVRFVCSIEEDLARRDFTINAMAWHPARGIADPFLGRQDLAAGVIRCVGDPTQRLREDALRIFRALRFASVLGFAIEPETDRALRKERGGLARIAPERIREELVRLLCGKSAEQILDRYAEIFFEVLEPLRPMRGFDQCNPHHDRDVWRHTLAAVTAAPADPLLRLAALLHDAGKPACFSRDGEGIGHFYGHAERSAVIADKVLRGLHCDGQTQRSVVELVRLHDLPLSTEPRLLRRRLARLGPQQLLRLIALQRADVSAQAPALRPERLARLDEVEQAAREMIAQAPCLSVNQMAIGGRELLARGVPQGPRIGALLHRLLEEVLDGRVKNERKALLARLEELLREENSGAGRAAAHRLETENQK